MRRSSTLTRPTSGFPSWTNSRTSSRTCPPPKSALAIPRLRRCFPNRRRPRRDAVQSSARNEENESRQTLLSPVRAGTGRRQPVAGAAARLGVGTGAALERRDLFAVRAARKHFRFVPGPGRGRTRLRAVEILPDAAIVPRTRLPVVL